MKNDSGLCNGWRAKEKEKSKDTGTALFDILQGYVPVRVKYNLEVSCYLPAGSFGSLNSGSIILNGLTSIGKIYTVCVTKSRNTVLSIISQVKQTASDPQYPLQA